MLTILRMKSPTLIAIDSDAARLRSLPSVQHFYAPGPPFIRHISRHLATTSVGMWPLLEHFQHLCPLLSEVVRLIND
jgi:hypothetical protein